MDGPARLRAVRSTLWQHRRIDELLDSYGIATGCFFACMDPPAQDELPGFDTFAMGQPI
jgi:hypothetical protein